MSSGRIAQHRNYGELMARHEKEQRLKRISRMFIYFLIILFMILLFLFVREWEKSQKEKKDAKTSLVISTEMTAKTPEASLTEHARFR
ncbi:MAG TPA: hypothetical protein VKZ68_11570 [Ohtaekwangia sp.]|nr:hypothetical protein [Ohtaekwangia sp.]